MLVLIVQVRLCLMLPQPARQGLFWGKLKVFPHAVENHDGVIDGIAHHR